MPNKTLGLCRLLIVTTLTFAVLTSCASKPITHVPGYDTAYYDESSSLALNALKLVYFNRYVSDAEFSNKDWQLQLNPQKTSDHFASKANSRASNIYKQLQQGANVDATRPFDQPNLISWIEVDSFKNYGSFDYQADVYTTTSNYILKALDADLESSFVATDQAASVEFSGDYCEQVQSELHPRKIRRGKWIGSGESVTCFLNFQHELIRPVLPQDWRPQQLSLKKDKQYVIVRTRIANFEAFTYGRKLKQSFVFFPHKRTTHKRGRSITAGKGTPFMQHQEQIFLFTKPFRGNEAIISANNWVYGNKLP